MSAAVHWIEPDWRAPPGVLGVSTTRVGGVSRAPRESFNLAYHVADTDAAVTANRRRLQDGLPPGTRIQWLTQVHGAGVVEAGIGPDAPEADAVWTRESGLACAVLTADCLPVLFCDLEGTTVAAAHAGWRGLAAGVLEATVSAMGLDPRRMMAWLGPAIGPARFEVGPEVRAALTAQRPAAGACFAPSAGRPGHYMADLYGLATERLRSLCVARISGGGWCTCSEPSRFFSYRRDGATGRMATLVMLRPSV
jgi:YfiH family protein